MGCRYYSEIMQVYHEEIKKLEGKLRRTQIEFNSAQFEVARLQEENNVLEIKKKNAVKEFAEKLKKVIHERDYVQGYEEIGLIEEIDELLKEYDK